MLEFLLLIVGFVVLVFGADKLVDGASSLASKLGVPDIVIGLTIVSLGTSAPELVVNIFAAVNQNTEMVLGNVIGSNLFNVLAILGVCALIKPLTVKRTTTWLEIPLSLLAAIAVLVLANDVYLDNATSNFISRSEGLILLLFLSIFLVYNLILARKGKADVGEELHHYSYLKSTLFVLLGLGGLVLGGKLIVDNAVSLALSFGMSERVVGLTIVSVGTSLPELATSVAAVRRNNVDIAVGNVVGSNIFNIFLVLGMSTIINPVPVNPSSQVDILINILAGLLLFFFTGKGNRLLRWEGGLFVLLYVGYISLLVFQS
ncbi:calcium/sodium antiporter [Rufibacter roseus]|uniref:Calcium/sodium antiporter n=1 Tax=Rufibacter roseus TaxID=1567108 RepID=A0ABW2DP92_9BACT|nr:calcium/sodium antiporter [Rufibacter roseus]